MKIGNYVKSIFVLCIVPLLFFTGSAAHAAAPGCGGWTVVSSPNAGSPNGLSSVAAVSANNVWAVGASGLQRSSGKTVIEHWNGSQWSLVSSPSPGAEYNTLTGVAAISASDIWAVGWQSSMGVAQSLTEHWNGSQWSVVSSPNPGALGTELSGLAVVSSNDVWAVGNMQNNTAAGSVVQTLIEHWNGSQWNVVTSPSPGSQSSALVGVSAASATNVWAVGYFANSSNFWQTLIEHWNGSQWSVVKSAGPGTQINYLSGVTTVSTTSAWAVGYADNQTLIEQWNGSQWTVVKSSGPGPVSNSLLSVTAISASNAWSVGYYEDSNFASHTLIEHWNGSQWSVVTSPSPGSMNTQLEGVSALSSSNIWAVGHADGQTLVEHYC